jgi:predicted esterase
MPEGVVAVEGGIYSPVPLVGLPFIYGDAPQIPRFFIDRTEVTNRAFQDFVAAGGYQRRELWPQRIEIGGREVSWGEAQSAFVDSTGRSGPARWELGDYPADKADHPVGGVSWYEATAYCAFRGRRLPTLFHWARAAFPSQDNGAPLSPVMARWSGFSQEGPAAVGAHRATSVAGAVDMGGNVAEWTLNAGGRGRYVLGGSWVDPGYLINQASSVPPDTRPATTGFRCSLYEDDPETEALSQPFEFPTIDFANIPSMSDEAFEQTRRLHAYQRSPLAAEVESSETLSWGAREEWVTIDAAYPGERIPIRLRLPSNGSPPYQVVVVVHTLESLIASTLRGHSYEPWEEFLVKTGRVLVEPVLAGTFERQDGRIASVFFESKVTSRDQYLLRWVQDLGRAIDYVEERPDLDSTRIAYLGTSNGAFLAPHLLPYEPRYRAAVLWAGGFSAAEDPKQVPLRINLCRRTTIPVLLLNGRYDYQMPMAYQKAMIDAFGAPADHKRHVIFEASHWPYPRGELIKETLGWLDRWLGPVGDHSALPAAVVSAVERKR